MKSLLKSYSSEFEPSLNYSLMNKTADDSLVNYVVDSWKSLEVVKNIKFIGYEYTEKQSEIDINKYIFKREKKKKKNEKFDYKFLEDNRFGKLTVFLEVTLMEKEKVEDEEGKLKETGKLVKHVYKHKKEMLIPLQDENGYYYIHGKKYYLIYQMVEKSTYTSKASVTLKSLMPIAVKRDVIKATALMDNNITDEEVINDTADVLDIDGNEYNLPVYNVTVFRKEIPIILFYLKDGFDNAMDFLGVSNSIELVTKPDLNDKYNIYFQISTKCYLKVNKKLFLKYPYLQSIVGGILHVSTNRLTIQSFDDPRIWIKKISGINNYDKGVDILNFFGRLLDETTKKTVKIHQYHKQDIYTLIRWMMQEFTSLRLKDNLALENKRLRCNEVISSLLTLEFSKRLNKIIQLGDKATHDNYKDFFKFPGDILLQKMHTSGILRFDESVNDMSFFSHFKYTSKGPHSLGGKNSNNIGIKYRDVHPSFLGRLDVLVCGNSDPGTSGLISPFGDISGFYFDDSEEKNNFTYLFQKDLAEELKKSNPNIVYIKLDFDSETDFYNALLDMQKYIKDNVKMFGTSREGHYEILISDCDDISVPDDNKNNEDIPSDLDE